MKRLLCITLLFVIGCASTPAQMYRPRGYDGDAWRINTILKPGLVDTELTIQINGDPIIKEKLSDFQSSYELAGKYEGRNITASCSQANSAWKVFVFVDNERAASF